MVSKHGQISGMHLSTSSLLFAGLCVLGGLGSVWAICCADRQSTATVEGKEVEHAVIKEDEDSPEVWDIVDTFVKRQTRETTKRAMRLLDEKLQNWDSHPAGVATSILEVVGEYRIEVARPYLVRFLHVDDHLEGSSFVKSTAARVMGMLGGPSGLEELQRLAREGPEDLLPSIATALGVLADPRSVPLLEEFARRPNTDLRARALSALSKYCKPTSKNLAVGAVLDQDDHVRNAAVFWLSNCGSDQDASGLVARLDDASPLVRMNALRGLARLGSRIVCGRVPDLVDDPDLSVREVAQEYARVCGALK